MKFPSRILSLDSRLGSFARRWTLALAALFLAAFALYLHSLSPAFHPDDSPETIAAGALLGMQHPPGYPLHSLLGRLAVLFGPGPATFNVNLLAALCGALVSVLAACILLTLGREFPPERGRWPHLAGFSLACGALLACTQTLWFEATIAKGGIYTLNMALSLGTLLAVLKVREAGLGRPLDRLQGENTAAGVLAPASSAPRALACAALLFGLGLANHWTSQVVLVPGFALLLAEARMRRRAFLSLPELARLVLVPGLVFLAALALYLYLPLRARFAALVWGDPSTWQGFWWIFSRSQYAGLEAGKTLWVFASLLRRIGADAAGDWTLPGLALVAGGWFLLFHKRPYLAFSLLALPLTLALAVAWKANPPSDSYFIIDPYLGPVHVGLGLGLVGWFSFPALRRRLALGVLACALGLGAWQWRTCDHSGDYLAWDYTNNLLLGAPKGALVYCVGDSNTAGPLVQRLVEGKRKDLTPLAAVLMDYPWYRAALLRVDPSLKLPPFYQGPAADLAWMAKANAPRPVVWTCTYEKTWVDERHLLHRGLGNLVTEGARPYTPALLQANRVWPAFALRGAFEPGQRAMDPITLRLVRDNYVEAVANLGEDYKALNAYDLAASEFSLLGVLRPGWGKPWLVAGTMAWYKGDLGQAGTWWKRAAAEEPSDAEAWADLGLVSLKQGRGAEAEGLARKALGMNPDLANAKVLLQSALQSEAAPAPRSAPDLAVGAKAAQEGDRLGQAGRKAESLAAYDKALRLGFSNSALYRNRGLMLGQLGRVDEAVDSLRKAAVLDPTNPELLKLQGYFLFNAGRHPEGLALLERALAMKPQDADMKRLVDDAKKKAGVQ